MDENLEEENFEDEEKNLLKASEIAKKVMVTAKKLANSEKKLLKIAEGIEAEIKKEGAKTAFPVNLSINGNAAHYTPSLNDEAEIKEKDLLKVDFGLHVEGSIIDCAFSVDFSQENGKLVDASQEALQNAMSVMKAGVNVKEVGAEIERTIKEYGFVPIENLCGHSLAPYDLHAGEEIPNVPVGDYELQEGDVFAVEPFASTGKGRVVDGDYCQIFSLSPESKSSAVRLPRSRKLLAEIVAEYLTLPFALRWFGKAELLNLAVSDLLKQNVLKAYPVLKEIEKGAMVSQAETTVIVEKDSVKVLV